MNLPSYYGASYIGAAALVGCIVGINIAALDNEIAAKTKDSAVAVNRANKGDKLPLASSVKGPGAASPTDAAFPKQTRFGCDPAFSAIADPAHAHIYKHCTV
jgi:hypothetical protein